VEEDRTMTYPKKSWFMAGVAAALLGGPALARAGAATGDAQTGDQSGSQSLGAAEARTVEVAVDGKSAESGKVDANKGEAVQLVFARTGGPEKEEVVLPSQGIVAEFPRDVPIALLVRSGNEGIPYTVLPPGGNGAEAWDAIGIEAGNSGGRG
jgi:hypothetical protein